MYFQAKIMLMAKAKAMEGPSHLRGGQVAKTYLGDLDLRHAIALYQQIKKETPEGLHKQEQQ